MVATGRSGTTAPFEILTFDLEKKRIGVALVPEGSSAPWRSTVGSGGGAGRRPTDKAGVRIVARPGRARTPSRWMRLLPRVRLARSKLRGALSPRQRAHRGSVQKLVLGGCRRFSGRQPHAVGQRPPLPLQALHDLGPRVPPRADDRHRRRTGDVDTIQPDASGLTQSLVPVGRVAAGPRHFSRTSWRGNRRLLLMAASASRNGRTSSCLASAHSCSHARFLDAEPLVRCRAGVGRGARGARPPGDWKRTAVSPQPARHSGGAQLRLRHPRPLPDRSRTIRCRDDGPAVSAAVLGVGYGVVLVRRDAGRDIVEDARVYLVRFPMTGQV